MIDKRICANQDDLSILQAKLVKRQSVKERLVSQIENLIELAILDLDKEEEVPIDAAVKKPAADFVSYILS